VNFKICSLTNIAHYYIDVREILKFPSAYDASLEKPSSGTLKIERLESQPKGLNRIDKVGYDHLLLREENLSFINNHIILELYTTRFWNNLHHVRPRCF